VGKAKQVNWRSAKAAPVVFVSGPEQYLADRAIRSIREQLRKDNASLEIHEIEASEYLPGQLAAVSSPSLFMDPRLVIISGIEKCTDAFIEEGLEFLEAPSTDTTLVLRHNSSSVRGKKLVDAIRASDQAVEIACLEIKKETERVAFIQAELSVDGRKVSAGAVRALSDAFADDLAELAAACTQLLSDQATNIDEATVDKYYGGRVETNAFKVADAALSGQAAQALALLRHALATGADPVPVVAAFSMKIRLMAKVYGNKYASASTVGAQPWQIERARKDLAGWSEDGLAEAVMAVASADAAVKGFERDPIYALEKLVLLLANRGQKYTEAR
jgi:DNA polymerase III subunit delta